LGAFGNEQAEVGRPHMNFIGCRIANIF